jgi:hypothetical protein
VFPVRYELDLYILFRRHSVFKGLINQREQQEFFLELQCRCLYRCTLVGWRFVVPAALRYRGLAAPLCPLLVPRYPETAYNVRRYKIIPLLDVWIRFPIATTGLTGLVDCFCWFPSWLTLRPSRGDMFLINVGEFIPNYTALQPRRSHSPMSKCIFRFCRNWGSHSGDYEENHILGYNAV